MKLKFVTLVIVFFSLLVISCGDKKSNNLKKEQKVEVKKILIVLTNNDKLGNTGHKTGSWIEELAAPYYLFKDKGYAVELASPKGGFIPFDPNSNTPESSTEDVVRFHKDAELQENLKNTKKLSDLKESNYDALFYPGGHGVLWDLVDDASSIKTIEDFNNANKPIGFVCHGPAALKNPKTKDGAALIKGRKVTGFSNAEESAVALVEVVPFLLEDMMIFSGGSYSNGPDWGSYVVVDGNLITGQNPASSKELAKELVKQLN